MIIFVILILLALFALYLYRSELEIRYIYRSKLTKKAANIGIVSDWGRKGVPYQSRFLSKCLSTKFNVHIFAYKWFTKDESDWGYNSLVFTRVIKPWKVINWIKKNKIKVVFFPDRLEDEAVLDWCRKNNVATVMDINYETIKIDEFLTYKKYAKLHCPVKCTQVLLRKFGFRNTVFIRWGIDNGIFQPRPMRTDQSIRLIHNAGYGGIEWRKNTLAAVEAFDIASKKRKNIRLFVKSQRPISEYPARVKSIIRNNDNIFVYDKDMDLHDLIDLYAKCHISVLPSKWEGIGIPFIESLAMGLPVLTVDAPPMNEWVRDGYNGFCAKVGSWVLRRDKKLLVRGALVDVKNLARKILAISRPKALARFRQNAINSSKDSTKDFTKKMVKLTRSLL